MTFNRLDECKEHSTLVGIKQFFTKNNITFLIPGKNHNIAVKYIYVMVNVENSTYCR